MALPDIVSRDEWLAARTALLAEEKEMTRARDRLNTKRRELPMVEITEPYRFVGAGGEAGLGELFEGRRQLVVGHFMFDPSWDEPCSSCSAGEDETAPGLHRHLNTRDTTYVLVSRAPYEKLARVREERGWITPWFSSGGSTFNDDFGVTVDPSVQPPAYNYRAVEDTTDWTFPQEMPGVSVFLRDGDRVFHTYSHFARGTESTGGSYYWLDLTALGRQEDWELPTGRADLARSNRPDFSS